MDTQICALLTKIFGQDLSEDLTQYISGIDSPEDLEEYIKLMLDFTVKEQRQVYEDIKLLKFGSQKVHKNNVIEASTSKIVEPDIAPPVDKSSPHTHKYKWMNNEASSPKKVELGLSPAVDKSSPHPHKYKWMNNEASSPKKVEIDLSPAVDKRSPHTNKVKSPNKEGSSSKKVEPDLAPAVDKKKKIKSFSKYQLHELSRGYLKEGRAPCNCQATKHKLINNCVECGRIVCEQEGSGPCFFCDNMVGTQEEIEVLNSNSKTADALYRALTDRKKSETWKKAMQHRNCLLESDKNSVQLNKVIDDEHDYFETNNKWISKKEREKAAANQKKDYEMKYGSRLTTKKYNLDILGKQMVETSNLSEEGEEEEDDLFEEESFGFGHVKVPDIDSVLKSLKELPDHIRREEVGVIRDDGKVPVILDKAFMEMRDNGLCLSMHQPFASLLVAGIKQHEGRIWYSAHRGPLWIAAASKPPDAEEIERCKQFYKEYHKNATVKFPSEYPTGCLLGRVLVDDCIDQEEYQAQFPTGESESPFVFICSYPQMLPIPLSMQGDHKIYHLKSDIYKQAREALVIRRRMT